MLTVVVEFSKLWTLLLLMLLLRLWLQAGTTAKQIGARNIDITANDSCLLVFITPPFSARFPERALWLGKTCRRKFVRLLPLLSGHFRIAQYLYRAPGIRVVFLSGENNSCFDWARRILVKIKKSYWYGIAIVQNFLLN